jgi:hypothetical protein
MHFGQCHSVTGVAQSNRPELHGLYLKGHELFLQKKFTEAVHVFEEVFDALPDDMPTKRLLDLCKKYLENPELAEGEFDVTKMTEK